MKCEDEFKSVRSKKPFIQTPHNTRFTSTLEYLHFGVKALIAIRVCLRFTILRIRCSEFHLLNWIWLLLKYGPMLSQASFTMIWMRLLKFHHTEQFGSRTRGNNQSVVRLSGRLDWISDTPPNALVKCLASHPDGAVEVGTPPPINLKYSIVLPPTILSRCISLTIVTMLEVLKATTLWGWGRRQQRKPLKNLFVVLLRRHHSLLKKLLMCRAGRGVVSVPR